MGATDNRQLSTYIILIEGLIYGRDDGNTSLPLL